MLGPGLVDPAPSVISGPPNDQEHSGLASPGAGRLSVIAFKVLEETAIEARRGPIERRAAHRLALAWMAYAGHSEPWRTARFWQLLGAGDGLESPDGQYCRDDQFRCCLAGWRRALGLPPKEDWYR